MLIFEGRNRVTSCYLTADRPNHYGLDIVGDDSKVIRSPIKGVVKSSTIITDKTNRTWEWGNYVRVDDSKGNRYYFCHMASRSVKVGDKVEVGTALGIMGNTGYSFGAHTHFEIRKADNKTRINPAEFLGIPNVKGTYTDDESSDGWIKSSGNKWQYRKNGKLVKSEWINDDGYWYFLGSDTYMKTGIQRIGGKLYYLNESRRENIPTGARIITDSSGCIKTQR